MQDLPRSGRSSTTSAEVNITKVKEMVTENRNFSLREIAAELSVSHESIRTILNDCLVVMEPRKQNLDRKGPRTSKMVNIDVTDVSKTKPRCFRCRCSITIRYLVRAHLRLEM